MIKYKQFIRRYRFELKLVEDLLSRFILYAPSRLTVSNQNSTNDNHSDSLNSAGGRLYDADPKASYNVDERQNNHSNHQNENTDSRIHAETWYALLNIWSLMNDSVYFGLGSGNGFTIGDDDRNYTGITHEDHKSRSNLMKTTTIILRSILSTLECLAPAIEVSALYDKNISTGICHDESGLRTLSKKHCQYLNLKSVIVRIERIRFWCRLGLLLLQYWKIHAKYSSLSKDNYITKFLSSVGILQCGGSILPGNENVIPMQLEQERVEHLLYVGRRTGRTTRNRFGPIAVLSDETVKNDVLEKVCNHMKSFPYSQILCLVLSEFLHIYRPLYWAQASLSSSLKIINNQKNDKTTTWTSKRVSMIKAWIISLAMDIISQKLASKAMNITNKQTGLKTNITPSTTREEMQRRKMRWTLYLLRAPIWDLFTYPVADKVSSILGWIVPFFGRPLAHYVMDLLIYCHKWHFMLEGSG